MQHNYTDAIDIIDTVESLYSHKLATCLELYDDLTSMDYSVVRSDLRKFCYLIDETDVFSRKHY